MSALQEISQENEQHFVPIREAAKRVSYSTDYVGRLAREGKINARRDGRTWLVELDSLKLFSLQAKADAIRKQEELKIQRRLEQAASKFASRPLEEVSHRPHSHIAILEATALTVCFALMLLLVQVSLGNGFGVRDWQRGVVVASGQTQSALAFDAIKDFKLPSWLWLFRYEKKEILLTEDNNQTMSNEPKDEIAKNSKYPPQIDLTKKELLIVYPENTAAENSKYIEDNFSDSVLVEFSSTRHGTVTPEFVSGEETGYPFRLVKAPVKPTTD